MSTSDAGRCGYLPESPYPGINPFNYAYRDVFFARESDARNLVRLIVLYRGVLLYSDSGVGKSSLINAGLIPLAQAEGYQPERIRVQPKKGRELVVERLSENVAGGPPFLPSLFVSGEQQKDTVLSVEEFEKAIRRSAALVQPLLIFDQFEEWTTLFEGKAGSEGREAQEGIRDLIAAFLNDRELRVKILIVLREDYLAKLQPLFDKCPNLPDQYLRLTPLRGDQIDEAIRGPFVKCPGKYRPEISLPLAEEIRRQFEARSEGADIRLTEVQIVCRSLFQEGQELEAYFNEKGVQGILEEYTKGSLESLAVEQRDPAVGLLTRMVTSAGTRNVISEDDLLKRVEREDGIPRELLLETLGSLDRTTRLVSKVPRREVYYYEIASEFLVGWIREKAQERQRLAERRELEERVEAQARERKRNRRIAAVLALALVALCGGLYACYDLYMRKHISYFNTIAKRWGIPQGVGALKWEQVQRRAVSLKFTTKGRRGPLLSVEAVNSRGQLTPEHGIGTYLKQEVDRISPSRECRWEYVRDSEGQILYEMAYDKDRSFVWGLVYSLAVEANRRSAHYVGPDGYPEPQLKSAAEYVDFEYSDRGHEEFLRYRDRNHAPIPGPDKAFGRRQVFDGRGLVVEMTSLGPDGKPMNDEAGNASLRLVYDRLGNVVEGTALDASGSRTTVRDGWSRGVFEYDNVGRCIEGRWFGIRDEPTSHRDGFHRFTARYDDRGNETEWACFDQQDRPTWHKDGYHRFTARYDKRGNQTEWAYFDEQGRPTLHRDGYHRSTARYDDARGNQTEWAYFDEQGQPTLHRDGYHRLTARYDERGNQVEWAYFDVRGRATVDASNGTHVTTAKYDERGNPTHWAYFNEQDQPALHKNGYYGYTAKYDDRGNQTEWAYFDEQGWPTLHKDRYHLAKAHYNERGEQTEVAYFDEQGRPTLHKDGYHTFRAKYDERGNRTEWAYFDMQGQATLDASNGTHITVAQYDARGNRTEMAHFGVDGERCANNDGVAEYRWEYDARGNRIRTSCFSANRKPCLDKVVVVVEVFPGSVAEATAIQSGDILVEIGGWCLFEDISYEDLCAKLEKVIQETKDVSKRLLLYRGGKFLEVEMPPGTMGIHVVDKDYPVTKVNAIRKAYEVRREGTASVQGLRRVLTNAVALGGVGLGLGIAPVPAGLMELPLLLSAPLALFDAGPAENPQREH